MPADTVKVDRSTVWGNPFVIGTDGTREECVTQYRKLVTGAPVRDKALNAVRTFVLANVHTLRGQNLACWCPLDGPCHADVLLALANGSGGAEQA